MRTNPETHGYPIGLPTPWTDRSASEQLIRWAAERTLLIDLCACLILLCLLYTTWVMAV